jgi:aryl-alcohol dehydrogenase-like predicted oxidoreductase
MNLSGYYDASDMAESQRVMDEAIDLGITFFDTSDYYAHGKNEEFIGACLLGRRDDVVLATKFGLLAQGGLDVRPERVRRSCVASLERLRTDRIDLFYAHRVDPQIPIEDTVGAMADLITEGLVLHLGLCEVSADTLRRAHAVHPIAALQSEWSLWTRDLESDLVPTARELGIALVPYSPLGRGFLAGSVTTESTFREGDFRTTLPRFTAESLAANEALVQQLRDVAAECGCTAGQLALAWLLAQGDDVIPIPGTRRVAYLRENAAAVDVHLSPDDLAQLSHLMRPEVVAGGRYHDWTGYSDTRHPGSTGL